MSAPAIENPYLAARREWQERYGSFLSQARNWRLACFGAVAVAIVTSSLALYATLRNPFTPIVVPIDAWGKSVGGVAGVPLDADTQERVRVMLMNAFITDIRTVTSDPFAQRQAVERVYPRLKSGSPAHTMLNEYYRNESPFERSRDELVYVTVNNVLRSSELSYEVEWTEIIRSAGNGEMKSKSRWRAVVTTTEAKPQDGKAAWLNPLGIYITNINWSKILEAEE